MKSSRPAVMGIAALLAVMVACNKSSSDTSLPSLGTLSISTEVPLYIAVGTHLSLQADVSAIKASDGADPVVALAWQVSGGDDRITTTENIKESNPPYDYTVTEAGDYTIYCYASSGSSYYSSSAYVSFTAVNPDTAVSGVTGDETVVIGGNTYWKKDGWLCQNLYTDGMGRSYRNCPVLDKGIGRLYSQEEALTLCPAGWHTPTVADFLLSFANPDGDIPAGDLMTNARLLEAEMWVYDPDVPITNQYRFNALPAGFIDATDLINPYQHYGHYACFWTADEENGLGTYVYIHENNPLVQIDHGDKKTLFLSARCVED